MTMDDETPTVDALLAALLERVLSNSVWDEVREIDGPHIVVCQDPVSGVTSYQGPYPNGMLALQSAQLEAASADADASTTSSGGQTPGIRYSVAPLHSPLALGD